MKLAFLLFFSIIDFMEITIDDFLGGKIKLAQSKDGYRSTSDSVLLASAVLAKPFDTILDVGTGNGVVLFCLGARVENLKMTGVDIQEELLFLAQKNNELNKSDIQFLKEDISKKNTVLQGVQFNHVVTNPPFYKGGHVRINEQQRIAFHEAIPLEKWIRFCVKHIKAGGTFTMIHQMEALPEILSAIEKTSLGGIEVIPLVKNLKESAKRIIVRGKLGSKKPFLLRNPIVLHREDGRNYTTQVDSILRGLGSLDSLF